MIKTWQLAAERLIQQDLASSGFEQICSSYHFRDLHCLIVHSDGELVRGHIIAPPYYEISEVAARYKRLRTEMEIDKGNLLCIWHSKAPIHACRLGKLLSVRPGTTSTGIDRFVIGIIGRAGGLRQILP